MIDSKNPLTSEYTTIYKNGTSKVSREFDLSKAGGSYFVGGCIIITLIAGIPLLISLPLFYYLYRIYKKSKELNNLEIDDTILLNRGYKSLEEFQNKIKKEFFLDISILIIFAIAINVITFTLAKKLEHIFEGNLILSIVLIIPYLLMPLFFNKYNFIIKILNGKIKNDEEYKSPFSKFNIFAILISIISVSIFNFQLEYYYYLSGLDDYFELFIRSIIGILLIFITLKFIEFCYYKFNYKKINENLKNIKEINQKRKNIKEINQKLRNINFLSQKEDDSKVILVIKKLFSIFLTGLIAYILIGLIATNDDFSFKVFTYSFLYIRSFILGIIIYIIYIIGLWVKKKFFSKEVIS